MKDWWQKLTIDWPCAVGDRLWALFVLEPVRLMDKITRRRVLHFIGLLLLLMFFQQIVMLDLTFLFGVDLGLLMEVAAGLFILAARYGSKAAVAAVRHCLVSVNIRITLAWRRAARHVRRAVRRLIPPADEDDLAGALA